MAENFRKSEKALIGLDIGVIIAFLVVGAIFYTDVKSNKRPKTMLTLTVLSALGASVTGGILSKDIKDYRAIKRELANKVNEKQK
jgi:thiamine monophosphate synthase